MKIVLVSDNHGDKEALEKVLSDNPCADYYIHCGDSSLSNYEIEPFASVKGNNDYYGDYPYNRVLEIEGHKIYICHGHREIYNRTLESLIASAKKRECDIVFFGHIHVFFDQTIDGIRLINPGSLEYNRDKFDKTYAIVEITKNNIFVTKKQL